MSLSSSAISESASATILPSRLSKIEDLSITHSFLITPNEVVKLIWENGSGASAHVIKSIPGRSVTVHTSPAPQISAQLVVKEYTYPLWKVVLKFFLKHRAEKAWDAARIYAELGLAVPRHHALVEEPLLGFTVYSVLISEFLPHARPLNDFLMKECRNFRERRYLLHRIARDLKLLHAHGIYNRDTKAENILVRREENDELRPYYIDLDGVAAMPFLTSWHRVHALAGLNASLTPPVSRSNRLRFLVEYLGRSNLNREKVRRLATRVIRASVARKHLWPVPTP